MELTRWSPWKEMETWHGRIHRLVRHAMFSMEKVNEIAEVRLWKPVVDMFENDNTFVIKAELPGIDKKSIDIDVTDGILTLKGERSCDSEEGEKTCYRCERLFGRFMRSFTLPMDVDAKKISANFKEGVLCITIPKPETEKPKKITVH